MSIWASWEHIGTLSPEPQQRGTVLSFAEGFSNHYPDLTGECERPAMVGVASIPEWCVPGHDESGDWTIVGEWLRLDVSAPEALDFWERDDEGRPKAAPAAACVVLNEAAVRALRDDLDAWLAQPKVRAKETK